LLTYLKYIMNKIVAYITIIACLLAAGCATSPRDTVFQTSTIDALLAGVYDGEMTCQVLLENGDMGIGTFDHLDGEMIVLNGTVYQVKADGKVYTPPQSIKTPFATVCAFKVDKQVRITPGTDYPAIEKIIDVLAPNKNLFCAIKIEGRFESMKTRSVPAQKKPYPPLKEVTKNQPEFEMKNIEGTIVGFRCPAYVKGINVPGYHLHFLSEGRTKGGHILSFKIERATCAIDVLSRYTLVLPTKGEGFSKADLSTDRTSELNRVERQNRP
jgi:acetolactate decarboxylase